MTRLAFRTAMRTAAVDLLKDYASDAEIKLQVYPGRPASIQLPTAFVDGIRETVSYTALNQRRPICDVIVLHGLFDSKAATEQADAFVDGFLDWSLNNLHAADPNTTVAITDIEDVPDYTVNWIAPEGGVYKTYFATRISLEGLALTG